MRASFLLAIVFVYLCVAQNVNTVSASYAYNLLTNAPKAYFLIDVRTAAEWEFVGVPSLPSDKPIFVEYLTYPSWNKNENFLNQTITALKQKPSFNMSQSKVIFMCKTGGRSIRAANEFSLAYPSISVLNIDHGFQGDLNTKTNHRNELNGWIASGNPYVQQ